MVMLDAPRLPKKCQLLLLKSAYHFISSSSSSSSSSGCWFWGSRSAARTWCVVQNNKPTRKRSHPGSKVMYVGITRRSKAKPSKGKERKRREGDVV